MCPNETGGVIVVIATLPVRTVRNVVGAIVAAEAIVPAFGDVGPCTVASWCQSDSVIGIVYS